MSQDTGEIREKMKVLSSDGETLGTVDRVDGDKIKLKPAQPSEDGDQPAVSIEKVEVVDDDAVHLLTSAKAALADTPA